MDHHTSVILRMSALLVAMPDVLDLSSFSDCHCGTSLVALHMAHVLTSVDQLVRKVALVRKNDVWDYEILPQWQRDAERFGA